MKLHIVNTSKCSSQTSAYLKSMRDEVDLLLLSCSKNKAKASVINYIIDQSQIVLEDVGINSAGNFLEMFSQQLKHHNSGLIRGKVLSNDCDFFNWDYECFLKFKDENTHASGIPFQEWSIEDLSCSAVLNLALNELSGHKIIIYCRNFFVSKMLYYIFVNLQIIQNDLTYLDDRDEQRDSFNSSLDGLLITHFDDLNSKSFSPSKLILTSPVSHLNWCNDVYYIVKDSEIVKTLDWITNEPQEGECIVKPKNTINSKIKTVFSLSKSILMNAIVQASIPTSSSVLLNRRLEFSNSCSLLISPNSTVAIIYSGSFDLKCLINNSEYRLVAVELDSTQLKIVHDFSKNCGFNICKVTSSEISYPSMLPQNLSLLSYGSELVNMTIKPSNNAQISALEYGWIEQLIVRVTGHNQLFTVNGVADTFNEILELRLTDFCGNQIVAKADEIIPTSISRQELMDIIPILECPKLIGVFAAMKTMKVNIPINLKLVESDMNIEVGKMLASMYSECDKKSDIELNGLGYLYLNSKLCPSFNEYKQVDIKYFNEMNKTFHTNFSYLCEMPSVDEFQFLLLMICKVFKDVEIGNNN
eukprot:NODE_602_length_6213_cov_0.213281.p1 type:complete len:586 gc:universal NODE_602_length_6213_cov_0.213281:1112-2869(+)